MIAGLNSWQAFELDVALAVKYNTLEQEEELSKLETIVMAIDNVVRAQGAKLKKRKVRKSLIKPYTKDGKKAVEDLPLMGDVIQQLTGGITIVNIDIEGLKEYGK